MSRRAIVALASVLLISVGLAAAAIAAKPGPALLPGKPAGVLNLLTRRRMRPRSREPKERRP